jgi:hypothetical protein
MEINSGSLWCLGGCNETRYHKKRVLEPMSMVLESGISYGDAKILISSFPR